MNSFLTEEDTARLVRKYSGLGVTIRTFTQSRYPRISRDTLMPIPRSCTTEEQEAWYPPGHGDFYQAFADSGLLTSFLAEGRRLCFISNSDNPGATVDLGILRLCLADSRDFLMEVTDKTRADVKGGTLIQYEGRLRLLEVAQVPKEHLDEFMDVKKFHVFNTNNLWIGLPAIQRVVQDSALDMEVIVNPLTVGATNAYQLVTAIGAAMKCFDNAIGLNVPRSRFLPVKKTSDLLLVMSNLYRLDHGRMVMSPQRMFPSTPLVKLGAHFSTVAEFLHRFGSMPDLLELDHLTVSGDVTFGRGVSLRGTVIIIAGHGARIDIPAGAVLENKTVSGNLRIMDH
jgi:UTP--glucose-1-phosphate uridylyltransferase